jgi:hypothetical protein
VYAAGSEIGNLKTYARAIEKPGYQNRRIMFVVLLRAVEVLDGYVHEAVFRIVTVYQAVEHRIAVEAGQAAPDHASSPVYKSTETTIADNTYFETTHVQSPTVNKIR